MVFVLFVFVQLLFVGFFFQEGDGIGEYWVGGGVGWWVFFFKQKTAYEITV